MRILGKRAKKEELVAYYERQLPLIHGNAGTSIWGPGAFFLHHGFRVRAELRRDRFDGLVKECPVCILFYYWRKGAKFGAHFVALHHKDGQFIGYNTYKNSTGPDHYGPSLEAFIKRQKYFGPVLISIRDKR